MIKVAINGYGTIGKRVADAVAAQKDMKVVGVSKTRPSAEAFVAKAKGYPLYIADLTKKDAFTKFGLPVAGSVEGMLKEADVVVDCTPGGVGEKNKPLYEKLGVKAIFQGGEEHELAGFSFCSDCNFSEAVGRQFVRVVSCNTTGLCRIINTMDRAFGVDRVLAVMVRRGSDPGEVKRGPVDAVVLDPVTIPSHHGPDVNTVLPHVNIVTLAMIVPTTMMHMHAVHMQLRRDAPREEVLAQMRAHPRIGLVKKGTEIKSTAELKEFVMDLGRPRSDLWENGVYEESVTTIGRDLYLFQAIHQEADVVVESVDAIRAMMGTVKEAERSIAMTNEALGFSPIR
ncbi:MAG: type II glyceraldehyde-3-phosphate dehydrogenase [Methanomicrobiales archaeon]|nr:type II glyceraldehyde-3-phosphate dehydrogenase [Methanomicrobiales archaeon]